MKQNTEKNDVLVSLYNSYVSRIHDFRREQHTVIVILTGLFSLTAKVILDLTSSKNLNIYANHIYLLLSIISLVLIIIYTSHSHKILVMAKSLQSIEQKLCLTDDIIYYGTHSNVRKVTFLISQFLPFVLYFSIAIFIINVAKIKEIYILGSFGAHIILTIAVYYFLFRHIGRLKYLRNQQKHRETKKSANLDVSNESIF